MINLLNSQLLILSNFITKMVEADYYLLKKKRSVGSQIVSQKKEKN